MAPRAAWSRGIAGALDLIAGVVLFALMALTCTDVVGRYFFGSPVRGGLELTEIMMTLLVFAGLPLVTMRREHVTVDIVPISSRRRIRRLHIALVDAVGAICLSVATWQLWARAGRAIEMGDVSSQLRMPIGPIIYIMAIFAGFAAFALVARLFLGTKGQEQ
jgi:TRAP-type C4-dicarboxylate transport system permease small subunit